MRRLMTMLLVASALAGCKGSSGYPQGTEKGRCYPNGTCNAGLTCLSDTCVDASPLAGGTGGTTTFDGAAGSDGAVVDAPLRFDVGNAPDGLVQDRESADTVGAADLDVFRTDTGTGGSGSGGNGGSDGSDAAGRGGSDGSSGGVDGGPAGGATGAGGRTGTGGTTTNPGAGGTNGKGGSSGSGGATTNPGTGGSGGSGGTTGTAVFQPRCVDLLTAAGVAPTKNGICIDPNDPQLCYKTCGPESIGFKSETCTAGVYVEQAGCSFPPGDYSCYQIPATMDPSCPAAVPQATTVCAVAPCTPCNLNGGYLDSSGAAKTGYCVCPAPSSSSGISKWSCAMTTAWPCPAGQGC